MILRLCRRLERLFTGIENLTLFSVVVVALLTALTNILLRKTTDMSLYWSDEIVRKAIFITTYMGCSAAIRQRSLIRIDALPQLLPVARKFFHALNHLGVMLFAGFLTYLGWQMTVQVYQDPFATTATLQLQEWYFYALFPLVGGMMLLRTLFMVLEDFGGLTIHPRQDSEQKGASS